MKFVDKLKLDIECYSKSTFVVMGSLFIGLFVTIPIAFCYGLYKGVLIPICEDSKDLFKKIRGKVKI